MSTTTDTHAWWSERTLPAGGSARWRIGPFELRAMHRLREWTLEHRRVADERDGTLEVHVPDATPLEDDAQGERVRFAFAEAPERIRVTPALADRPLVFSALSAFRVPAGEDVTLFMSSSIWVEVRVGDGRLLVDVPAWRPSDTWFGPNTRVGELCYSSQTRARLAIDDTTDAPHRALSVVRIQNRGRSHLAIERIKLPMPALSLYAARDGRLYTEGMTLRRDTDDELAEVQLSGAAPAEAHGAVRLGGPRTRVSRGLVHVFGRLFDA